VPIRHFWRAGTHQAHNGRPAETVVGFDVTIDVEADLAVIRQSSWVRLQHPQVRRRRADNRFDEPIGQPVAVLPGSDVQR
jgi:hypothetical protein